VVLVNGRRFTSLVLLTSLAARAAVAFSSSGTRSVIGCGLNCERSRKRCNDADTILSASRVGGYAKWCAVISPTTRCHQCRKRACVSIACYRSVATSTSAAQPKGSHDLAANRAGLAADFLPPARILHPWPSARFAVKHPRWEPNARIGLVRICGGVLGNEHSYRKGWEKSLSALLCV
jgi:hypothetical protein